MNKAAIVLFSGVDEAILERKAHECGAHGYIPKSVSSLELARRVASYLQLATAASD
jgi:DNA-binding NarL/FixJ family response regulator